MTPFDPFTLDRTRLAAELANFERRLGPDTHELGERDGILPLFKGNPNLASLVGFRKADLTPNLIKFELGFFGDHACDLAIGDATTGQFCFVEFEEATATSVFKKTGRPDWSARFEHGFSQIVDWFQILDDMKNTNRFREQFGTSLADYTGLLVVGRGGFLDAAQRNRLRWRSMNVLVAGRRVECLTFDDLLREFKARVDSLLPLSAPPTRPKRRRGK